jgi:hypothetical protein
MKLILALLVLLFAAPALALDEAVEATTAINLPVDSITIYPDGLMAAKRTGSLEVSQGLHNFVVKIPESAEKSSLLLTVTNSTVEKVVYEANPIYTLNISSPGSQLFALSYLMYNAGYWVPRYDLHLTEDSVTLKANAIVQNSGEEDLKNVLLRLVAGLPPAVIYPVSKARAAPQQAYDAAALSEAAAPAPAPAAATGELETMYIFELEGRKDLEMKKEIGLPLFEHTAPLLRIYIWDASMKEEGPIMEEIRANNTMDKPWPSGDAMLYRNGEYVSTINMPYTPAGTNASIEVGSSPDLKVEKKLKDYNITEKIRDIVGSDEKNHTVKETTETWAYHLKIESNLDRPANLEVTDSKPQEGKLISVSMEPAETTATMLKWKLTVQPRDKPAIDYAYQIVRTETLKDME